MKKSFGHCARLQKGGETSSQQVPNGISWAIEQNRIRFFAILGRALIRLAASAAQTTQISKKCQHEA